MTAHPGGDDRPGPVVLYLAGVSWDAVQGTDHRLVEHLRRRLTVVWVDPPMSLLRVGFEFGRHLARRLPWCAGPTGRAAAPATPSTRPTRPGLHRLDHGLWRLHTVVPPGPTRPVLGRLSDRVWHDAVRRVVRRFPGRGFALFASRPDVDFGLLPTGRRVLHVTDDFVAGASLLGVDADRTARALDVALGGADEVLAVTPELAATLETRLARLHRPGVRVQLLPNGCDPRPATAAAPGTPVTPGAPPALGGTAGVVGQLNDRLDLDLLEAVADAGHPLLLVGPRGRLSAENACRLDALVARPTVQWTGAVAHADLPGYLARLRVGLTPYTRSDFNRASDPLKTLEYLAHGIPVVSADLPAARRLDPRVVDVARGPAEFAVAVTRRLGAPDRPHLASVCRGEAARHSWAVRAHELADVLLAQAPPHAPSPPSASTHPSCPAVTATPSQEPR